MLNCMQLLACLSPVNEQDATSDLASLVLQTRLELLQQGQLCLIHLSENFALPARIPAKCLMISKEEEQNETILSEW